jgi:hypothetical protein
MSHLKSFGVIFLGLGYLASAAVQRYAPLPVSELGREADLVVVASVDQYTRNSAGTGGIVQLRTRHVLKGQPTSVTLFAQVAPPSQNPKRGVSLDPEAVGGSGLWFLKNRPGGGYEVLQWERGSPSGRSFFLPVTEARVDTVPPGTLDQQLLAYVVDWYQSASEPDDLLLQISLELLGPPGRHNPSREDALAAIAPLIASSSPAQHGIGLAIALEIGSSEALGTVVNEMPTLKSNPKIRRIVDALTDPGADHSGWLPGLQQLAFMHADVPGLDAAVASALFGIGTQPVIPAMAELLDSKDPEAQRRASLFFGRVAAHTNANGEFSLGAPPGPFWTAQAQQYSPRPGSALTPADYAAFWKSWWTEHRAMLGFPAQ